MEDDNKFGATGALFTAKSKRTEKSPDYNGSLEFEMDVVNDLIAQKNEGIAINKSKSSWLEKGRQNYTKALSQNNCQRRKR